MKNEVSVAMATYNGAKFIVPQIMSIVNQSLAPKELIIVDDASSDDTVGIINGLIKDYPFIKLHINEINIGPVESFRKCVSLCNYDYIALADQDDIWEQDKLSLCVNKLSMIDESYKPAIVFTDLKVMNSNEEIISSSFWDLQGYNVHKHQFIHVLIGNIITGCTIMMNRQMKIEIEKMPVNVTMHDHWIATVAYGIGNHLAIHESPIKYRVHENSVTNKSKITLFQRVGLFFSSVFDNDKLYIQENIIQATQFYELYKSGLTDDKKKSLLNFIALKNKNSLYRKLYIGYIKYISNS